MPIGRFNVKRVVKALRKLQKIGLNKVILSFYLLTDPYFAEKTFNNLI